MSIAAALESNLRERVRDNLPLVTELIVDDTRANCSRRTGALADAIVADTWTEAGSSFTTTIHVDVPYAAYQEFGTGIYGPDGARIAPVTAKVLAFDWPAAGGMVFARSVAGAPGTHFFFGESGTAMQERYSAATLAAFA